eukprot:COSAG02_NODE_4367_length_5445_cov_2.017770_1_plen_460_part_00
MAMTPPIVTQMDMMAPEALLPPPLLLLALLWRGVRVAAQLDPPCASVDCYLSECVDAAVGAPELGEVASSCEAAVLLVRGECSAMSNSIDSSLLPGVMVGQICPRRCGWCKCASVSCYLDSCVDAAPEAPELGVGGTCEAVVAATNGDCSITSAELDQTLPVGIPVGMICPASCYWCSGHTPAGSGVCADVEDGDAMLGDAGSCAAAIDEANGDCSRPPGAVGMAAHCSWTGDCSGGCEASATCAGDAAVCHTSQVLCEGVCSAEHQASWCDGPGDGGVPTLGELCPRSCGWCSSPLDFLRLDLVNKSFCVHHEAASCLPADGCTSAAECQRKACALVDITSQPHPVTAAATCEAVPGCFYQRGVNSPAGCVVHPFTMSVQEMAWLLGIMNGETGLSGINADVCLQQGLDGTAVISITQDDFIHFGLTYSQAAGFIAGRDRSTYSIHVLYCLYVRALLR